MPDSENDIRNSAWSERLKNFFHGPPQTRNDLVKVIQDSHQRKLIAEETLEMMEGALQIADLHVRDVMIPRAQMVALPYNGSLAQLADIISKSGHSRFPVIGENRDDVIGILLAKDLLQYCMLQREEPFNIRELLRNPVFVPESKRLNILLREFRGSRNHLAMVVDEYGGVAGLVTIEDVIEEIVGEIDDEHDLESRTYIKPSRGKDRYILRALTPVEVFNDYFGTEFSDMEFDTIGGILLKAFGHLPKRGERLDLEGFRFEVLRADNRRIHMLSLQPLSDTSEEENPP